MDPEKIACYTFLPWARKGVAAQIKEQEKFGAASSAARASFDVDVLVNRKNIEGQTDDTTVSKSVSLFGPGDIIGIDKRTIIRTEPRTGTTNFEPNYLPYIEFHEEDYIWRYTPASPAGTADKRLRPWLALVVLKESEFNYKDFSPTDQPLPSIDILETDQSKIFPLHDEYWAWGHVHTNQLLSGSDSFNEGQALQGLVNSNPNLACCRLLCPRKLEPNTRYHAFVIPSYEKGRLAGLGAESTEIDAEQSQLYSWANPVSELPFYYNWTFRTGDQGDFEALVNRLEIKELDTRVGRRLIDIQNPGYGISYDGDDELVTVDENDIEVTTGHKGAIYLEGALRAPQNQTVNFIKSADSEATVKQLGDALNLDDDLRNNSVTALHTYQNHPHFTKNNTLNTPSSIEDDPIITPPIYGKWHNLVNRVETQKSKAKKWINHLNLDPRQRTAAGFGTDVIQKNQENYMDRAWGQFGAILEANRRLIQAQFVERFSSNLYKNKIQKLSNERLLQGTSNIHSRVRLNNKLSVAKHIDESRLANAMVTAEFTKTTRPNGPVTSFLKNQKTLNDKVFSNVAKGAISAAPKYDEIAVDADGKADVFKQSFTTNQNIVTGGLNRRTVHVADFGVVKTGEPNSPKTTDLGKLGAILGKPVKLDTIVNLNTTDSIETTTNLGDKQLDIVKDTIGGIEVKDTINPNLDLSKLRIQPVIDIVFDKDNFVIQTGVKEDLTISFRDLDKEVFALSEMVYTNYLDESNWSLQAPKANLSISGVSKELREKINPEITYTSRVLNKLSLGDKFLFPKPETIKPILVAPEFCDPMYKELVKISSELFLPNLNLIKNNSISVLETNPEFIESYMVGLNHEFSRELLWREFLTDQRGSYFRQFWDTYSKSKPDGEKKADFEENKKDIKPIHTWGSNKLGENQPDNQESGDKTVLVIRGDLLKKYPNTIIFMQEAAFEDPENPDLNEPRILKPKGKIITPSFEAKIDPDIYFIGFDISVVDARGDKPNQKPGYFFVLQERTGEIHFGMDTELQKNTLTLDEQIIKTVYLNGIKNAGTSVLMQRIQGLLPANSSWNDLAWEDITGNASHIDVANAPVNPTREGLTWGDDAASMASILYQNPFMMAIHASEMISKDAN